MDVIPPHTAPFEEVKGKVLDDIVKNRVIVAVQRHAQELLDKAKSMGGDLEKAAKSLGLETKTSDEFTRNGSVEGIGSASYFQEAFTRPDGTLIGPVSTADATVVAKVAGHAPADLSKLAEQRVSVRDELKSQKARERSALFEAGLRDTLVKQGKIKYHKDALDRLLAAYRAG